jgi:predicted ester cyclase
VSEAVFRAHYEQIWNDKDISGIPRFIAPNYRGHDPSEPAVISGVEGYKLHFTTITTAFPDLRLTIEGILGVDERVAARWLAEGTHTGDFGTFPPSGARVRLKGMSVALIRNRQLVEEHSVSDTLGLLKQIGVIPDTVAIPPILF